MKYDLRSIMKAAWEMKRSYSARALSFGDCLRRAWANAKAEMADAAEYARLAGQEIVNGMEITFEGMTCTLNRWTKGNQDRVYINGDCRKSYGYVDLKAKADCTINVCWSRKMAKAILSMAF